MTVTPSDETSPVLPAATAGPKSSTQTAETAKIIDVRTRFIAFYDEEYDLIVRFVVRCGAGLQSAEDATQEAFRYAWEHYVLPGTWEEKVPSPRAWIRTVAFRCWKRPPGPRRRPMTILVPEYPDDLGDPDSFAELTLETLSVLDALNSLDPLLRAIMAFTLDRFTAVEIGAELNIDPQKVRDQRKKARKILARRLNGGGDQGRRVV